MSFILNIMCKSNLSLPVPFRCHPHNLLKRAEKRLPVPKPHHFSNVIHRIRRKSPVPQVAHRILYSVSMHHLRISHPVFLSHNPRQLPPRHPKHFRQLASRKPWVTIPLPPYQNLINLPFHHVFSHFAHKVTHFYPKNKQTDTKPPTHPVTLEYTSQTKTSSSSANIPNSSHSNTPPSQTKCSYIPP